MAETERWKNQARSTAFVLKYDRYNNLTSEIVTAGHEVTISKEEREINQERAVSSELDVFKNGILTPIKLVDPEDEKEFASNPNLLSSEELADLLKLSKKAFEGRIAEMNNMHPLLRLKEIIEREDTKVTMGVVQALDERIAALKPASPKMTSFADEREV